MRIISDFYDYYDSVQGTIFDKDTIYFRKQRQLRQPDKHPINETSDFYGFWFDIGFCGKIYTGYKFICQYDYTHHAVSHCYSWDDVEKFLESNFKEKERRHIVRWREVGTISEYIKEMKRPPYFGGGRFRDSRYKHPDRDFIPKENESKFLELKAPIFTQKYNLVNPCLKDYEFYKVKDAYTAFQELYQWHCNQASLEKPIPYVDDKTLAECKGFDKYSFRKEKQKK